MVDLIALPDFVAEKNRPDRAWGLPAVVAKPLVGSIADTRATIDRLVRLVVVVRAEAVGNTRSDVPRTADRNDPSIAPDPRRRARSTLKPEPQTFLSPELICIGISTGGPEALTHMLPMLPVEERLADEVVPLAAIAGVVVRLTCSEVGLCR